MDELEAVARGNGMAAEGGLPLVAELLPCPGVEAALRALADRAGVLLLDSALVREPVGRYSFLTADPFRFFELPQAGYGVDPFQGIREALAEFHAPAVPGLPPFQGGAAGLLSYELGRAWEELPRSGVDEFELPDLAVGVYDWVLAWDHAAGRAWIISQGFPETDPNRRRGRAAARMQWVFDALRRSTGSVPSGVGWTILSDTFDEETTYDGQDCPSYGEMTPPSRLPSAACPNDGQDCPSYGEETPASRLPPAASPNDGQDCPSYGGEDCSSDGEVQFVSRQEPRGHGPGASAIPSERLVRQYPLAGAPGLSSDFSRDGYLQAVGRVIDYIFAGDIFQANLSQRLLAPWREPAVELYARLRRRNPAPFAAYFAYDDWAIASASPERFLCLRGGEVETRPIKGTRRRRSGPEADLFTRDELRESEKDQAENLMIVDLLRNDLSRVCRPGTIRVPRFCSVETYETVQHLVTEIRGRLAAGRDAWDLLAAAFPGGSITGAPKVRAMQIIDELEPTVRGPYCGSLFYVGCDGSLDSNILIRTFTCRRGWLQCPVGGGIVAQSNPADEYTETLDKAAGMLRAMVE